MEKSPFLVNPSINLPKTPFSLLPETRTHPQYASSRMMSHDHKLKVTKTRTSTNPPSLTPRISGDQDSLTIKTVAIINNTTM